MSLHLSLVPTQGTLRSPSAWFIPGSDARTWLAELVSWDAPPRGPCLFVVPGEGDAPCGVLVSGHGVPVTRPSSRAQPYGRVGRLVLPVDARLDPPVSSRELEAVPGALLLLHPQAGFVGFRGGDALSLRDLLAAPASEPGRWRVAERGDPPLPRLRSVTVQQTRSLQELLQDVGEQIGQRPPEELPPEPEEQAGSGNPAKWAGGQLAKAARWLSGKDKEEKKDEGKEEAQGSWIDRLENWSQSARQKLKDVRERELERLLGMLERDPDQGLRYALPLSGGNGGRGVSPPGARLGPRDTDLDLDRPRGGGAADPWEVDAELFARLRARYREAASRELRLGRTRRAAYIFLELLGDGQAAANALEQGRHYRDAARLFRERLGRPLDAARCLERGGLLEEAAGVYRAERHYLQAAELMRKLGRSDEAERLFRQAVEVFRTSKDPRSAARILEEKVGAPDEALELLAETWPHGAQAAGCLQDRFGLLGRLGRHAATAELVRSFTGALAPSAREPHLVECLVHVAGEYPDREVRTQAKDAARVVAGTALPVLRAPAAERMLRAVARLDPGDRLLGRDVRRYVSELRVQKSRGPRKLGEAVWEDEFRLPEDVEWQTAVPLEGGVLLAGQGWQGVPVVLRANWKGTTQLRTWSARDRRPGHLIVAAPEAIWDGDGGPIVVAYPGHSLRPIELPATDVFPSSRVVGTPSWLPDGTLAVAASGASVWALYLAEGEVVLAGMDGPTGALFSTEHVFDSSPFEELPQLSLLAQGLRLVLARGESIEIRHGAAIIETIELGHEVLQLCAGHQDCVAVATRVGGSVLFRRGRRYETHPFAAGMPSPYVAFSSDGRLVAMTRFEARVYATDGYGLRHLTTFAGPGEDLIALLPAGRGQLATISPQGRVRLFRLPVC